MTSRSITPTAISVQGLASFTNFNPTRPSSANGATPEDSRAGATNKPDCLGPGMIISLVLTFCEGLVCWDGMVSVVFSECPLVFADRADTATVDIGTHYRTAFALLCRNWTVNNVGLI